MKTAFVTLLLAVAFVAARKDYTGYKVLQVTPQNVPQLRGLLNIQNKYDGVREVDFWNHVREVGSAVSVQVAPQMEHQITTELLRHGLTSEVIIQDLQTLITENMKPQEGKTSGAEFQLDQYHDYDNEIVPYLTSLSAQHPGTEYRSIGKTVEGRDLYMFSIATGDKPAISIECNIHAREWITGATCLNIITNLLTTDADKDMLDAYDWYFIPIANPDGFQYTWSDDRMWRKNRKVSNAKCTGVDLNRNFDADFGGSGSSSYECSETYCGTAAFSEPETQASSEFILSLKGGLKFHMSFHSYGQYYLLPWCYNYDGPQDFTHILNVAQTSGEALKSVHGTTFEIGECAKVLYVASGCTSDWVYKAAAPQFSATMELRDRGFYGFILPADQIIPVYEEVWTGLKAALNALQ